MAAKRRKTFSHKRHRPSHKRHKKEKEKKVNAPFELLTLFSWVNTSKG
jgi:hypothetical protein